MQPAYFRIFRLQQLDFGLDDGVFGEQQLRQLLVLGSDDGLQKTLLCLKRFVLELDLQLQPRDIRFRPLQL